MFHVYVGFSMASHKKIIRSVRHTTSLLTCVAHLLVGYLMLSTSSEMFESFLFNYSNSHTNDVTLIQVRFLLGKIMGLARVRVQTENLQAHAFH